MAYRLKATRSARKDVRRVAAEQLQAAAEKLAGAPAAGRAEAVHEARKSIKKTRALLRLTRSGMPRDAYRERMTALRDTGRLLSGARDADVMAQTLDGLREPATGRIPARALGDLRRDALRLAASDGDDHRDDAVERLRALAEDAAAWPVGDVRWSTIRKDAARTYARGRERLDRARSGADAEALHEWRKPVKDLWYHQRLLRSGWKPVMKTHAGETDRLGELLGDDHDLHVLAEHLRAQRDALAKHGRLDDLLELIDERRAALQAEAFALGARIYAEKPGAYAKRVGRYLEAKRREGGPRDRGHASPG